MLMNLPFSLPDWMPGWVFLLLALPVLLYLLAFLMMPFSVFGVKARIKSLETQIDALHEDVRTMTMRGAAGVLPPPAAEFDRYANNDVPHFGRIKNSQRGYVEPEPPPAREPLREPVRRAAPTVAPQPVVTPTPVTASRERLAAHARTGTSAAGTAHGAAPGLRARAWQRRRYSVPARGGISVARFCAGWWTRACRRSGACAGP